MKRALPGAQPSRAGRDGEARRPLLERAAVTYALRVYLPLSGLSRRWRDARHPERERMLLPSVRWTDVFPELSVGITELRKSNGNVRISELAVLALAAAQVTPGHAIIEIGTFDGRTTLNLALNAPASCPIMTLDLPADHPTRFDLMAGERAFVQKRASGSRFTGRSDLPNFTSRIRQLFGDSATFDWRPYERTAGLIFIDGSHQRDYVRADTRTACRLAAENALVVWHDYGVWRDVTVALNELARESKARLQRIRGTSLVVWRHSPTESKDLLRASE